MQRSQKHLIVDGWNVIHSDQKMKHAFTNFGQEGAKKLLSDSLAPIHDCLGYKLTIVYDGKGEDISIEKIGRQSTFTEVYTPSCLSADEFIEQMCANAKQPNSLLIASRDNLIRLSARGFKIECITSQQLLEWAKNSAKNLNTKVAELKTEIELDWKRQSPLAQLDKLVDIPQAKYTPLKMKAPKSKKKRK